MLNNHKKFNFSKKKNLLNSTWNVAWVFWFEAIWKIENPTLKCFHFPYRNVESLLIRRYLFDHVLLVEPNNWNCLLQNCLFEFIFSTWPSKEPASQCALIYKLIFFAAAQLAQYRGTMHEGLWLWYFFSLFHLTAWNFCVFQPLECVCTFFCTLCAPHYYVENYIEPVKAATAEKNPCLSFRWNANINLRKTQIFAFYLSKYVHNRSIEKLISKINTMEMFCKKFKKLRAAAAAQAYHK